VTRYEKALARFRHMMAQSIGFKGSDADLLDKAKGDTLDEKLHSMEAVTAFVSPRYWEKHGL
jgi:hypothetical protein